MSPAAESTKRTYLLRRRWGSSRPRVTEQPYTNKRQAMRLLRLFEPVALVFGQELVCATTGAVLRSYGMEAA